MSGLKKVFKKVTKQLVKFDIVHQGLKSMGLPDPVNDLAYGDEKALTPAEKNQKMQQQQMEAQMRAEKDALDQQRMFDEQARTISANAAGLSGANAAADTTKFELGGTDAPDAILDDMRKRRKGGTTSSQLGIV